jgi:hypothetical protein
MNCGVLADRRKVDSPFAPAVAASMLHSARGLKLSEPVEGLTTTKAAPDS